MSTRNRFVTPMALVLSMVPLPLFSQSSPPASIPTDQVQLWIVEMQHLQTQLAPIEDQALQDPTIAREQEDLGNAVLAAMLELDPTVQPKLERLRQIMMEAHAYLGDDAKLQALAAEAGTLQPHIERARGAALARPDIETQMAAFRKNLCDRMVLIAPESRQMVERFEELEKLVRASLQGANSPAGSPL